MQPCLRPSPSPENALSVRPSGLLAATTILIAEICRFMPGSTSARTAAGERPRPFAPTSRRKLPALMPPSVPFAVGPADRSGLDCIAWRRLSHCFRLYNRFYQRRRLPPKAAGNCPHAHDTADSDENERSDESRRRAGIEASNKQARGTEEGKKCD